MKIKACRRSRQVAELWICREQEEGGERKSFAVASSAAEGTGYACSMFHERACEARGVCEVRLVYINALPFANAALTFPSGQREHNYCYISASSRGGGDDKDKGRDGVMDG